MISEILRVQKGNKVAYIFMRLKNIKTILTCPKDALVEFYYKKFSTYSLKFMYVSLLGTGLFQVFS